MQYRREMHYAPSVPAPAPTSLERALDAPAPPAPAPLDALRLAREQWLQSGRLDMGRLVAELGVSRATLYRWVGTKERLLGEVLWTFAQEEIAAALAATRSGRGPSRVASVVERYMRAASAFAPLRRFVEQDPEYALRVLASKHSPMQRRSIAALRDLLEDEERRGALRPPFDLDDLAYVIVRIVESYLYNDVISGGEPDVGRAVTAIDALLRAPRRPRR